MTELRELVARKIHAERHRKANLRDWASRTETEIRGMISSCWPREKDKLCDQVDAVLDALDAIGFVAVPASPTKAMLEAPLMNTTHHIGGHGIEEEDAAVVWCAMIEAANHPLKQHD